MSPSSSHRVESVSLKSGRGLAILALLGALCACSSPAVAPVLPQPLPPSWPQSAAFDPQARAPDLRGWWRQFADPELDALVNQALADNIGLAQARQRIQQARILLGNVDTNYLPEIHAQTQGVQSADGSDSFFQYGLDASWELGLFGRRTSANKVAEAQLADRRSEAQAVRVSVVAEVVRTYIELRSAQRQLQLAQRIQALDQEQLQLLGARASLGLSATADVAHAQAALAQDSAAMPQHQQDIDQAAWRLALLLGQTQPEPAWLASSAQPVLTAFAFTALPADLLRTRPEVQIAEAAVLQAAGELGVAKADLYPDVSLAGSFKYSVNVTQNFVRDGDVHATPSLAPIVDMPLFDWGRRRAVVHAHEIGLDSALLGYRQAVLNAIGDTRLALSALAGQQARVAQNQAALNSIGKNRDAAATLNRLGLSSRLQSLQTEQQQVQAELALSDAQAGHDLAFVALYKALGGAPLPHGEGS